MKYFNIKTNLSILACSLLLACGGGGDGDDEPDIPDMPVAVTPPGVSTLIFPDNNEECTEGEVLNDTQSSVLFQWNTSTNTSSYEVNLTNLNTNSLARIISNTNSAPITLMRGTPYEWFVISKGTGTTETAQSSVWRFYNAGEGVLNYAPFPAIAVVPQRGSSLSSSGNLTLEWTGSDVDDNIIEYEVFFGTISPPETSIGVTSDSTISTQVVGSTTYYWRVVTKDSSNNTSSSEIFEFKTN